MKQLFSILLIAVLLASCEKEKAIIDTNPKLPDTVELEENNISGNIKNTSYQAIGQSVVTVFYQEYILGTTTSLSDGSFELQDQPIHAINSYVAFTKEGYSPNYFSTTIENTNAIALNPILKTWLVDKAFDNKEATIELSEIASIAVDNNLLESNANAKIQAQFLDFSKEDKNLLLARRSVNQTQNFSHALFININDDANSIAWNSNKTVLFKLNNDTNLNLEDDFWWFDKQLGYWVNQGQLSYDGSSYNASLTGSGYYAFSSSCTNDVIAPTPYCINISTFVYDPASANEAYAVDFNVGSFDNCTPDTNLVFKIKKVTDVCQNGSDQLDEVITLCSQEVGTSIALEIHVFDEQNNSDYCIVNLEVIDNSNSDCTDDVIAPTPYCFIGLVSHFPDLNDAEIYGTDFDLNSFDNCDMDLNFEIRRLEDLCGNGSDVFAESLFLCPSDDGLTIDIVLKVTDDALNADSCFTSIQVTGDTIPNGGCVVDIVAPVPYCVSLSSFVYNPASVNEAYAVDFNIGSFDNCTLDEDLIFKIKKVTDVCQNGSDQLDETVTLCSSEVGTTIMLEIHVFDEQDNSSYCVVNMQVAQ